MPQLVYCRYSHEHLRSIWYHPLKNARKTASILDTFSCIFQGMIPYGAQMLVAISAVHELGHEVSAFNILPYLFYPMFLLVSSLVAVFVVENGRKFN